MGVPLLVFTDLDGTLLDHHTYSCAGATEALRRLHRLAIPVVLTSSKTCAEMLDLQQRLGLREAFIVENGGGIFLPDGHPLEGNRRFRQIGGCRGIRFGRPYPYVREIFAMFQAAYGLKGFGDMTVEEIELLTGLPTGQARLAARRDFSEPFLFLAKPHPRGLSDAVAEHGLTVTKGGRFYHLISAGQDKGRAVAEATRLFQEGRTERFITVGLGDAENDLPMLRVVDIPVSVPRPDGRYENLGLAGIRKAPWPGSTGWGAAVSTILDEYSFPDPGSQTEGSPPNVHA